ncbi:MAG: branched-chain amino acid transaminase, partial [Candidatus Bathyarchaeia archaeon]
MAIKEVEYVWMDGNFVKWNEATVHILTHALHYGTGVFEGIRGYAGANNVYIFRLREHMKRLRNSAKVYMMDIPYSQDDLCTATIELLKKNNIRETCYIRPLVYRGFGVIGLNPINSPVKTAIAAFPFGKYLGTGGVNCCVSSWRRISSSALPPEAKACGNYINSVLAKLEAIQNGFDEAILLDQYGYVSEGSGENIFIVRD